MIARNFIGSKVVDVIKKKIEVFLIMFQELSIGDGTCVASHRHAIHQSQAAAETVSLSKKNILMLLSDPYFYLESGFYHDPGEPICLSPIVDQKEALDSNPSLLEEASYLTSLGAYHLRSMTSEVCALIFKGTARPLWSRRMHLGLHLIRQTLHFDLNTMAHARKGTQLLQYLEDQIVPKAEAYNTIKLNFGVDLDEILAMEKISQTIQSQAFPIPDEVLPTGYQYRLKGEWIEPTPASRIIESSRASGAKRQKVLVYLHGGAYILLNPTAYRSTMGMFASETGYTVFALDYRLAPENPFPAAIHDVLAAYIWLLNPKHSVFGQQIFGVDREPIRPEDIIMGGDSAGGGLVLAFFNYLNHYLVNPDGSRQFPLPGGAFLMSPWTDLTFSSESCRTNAEYDYLPRHMHDIHTPIFPGFPHPVYSYILGENLARRLPPIENRKQAHARSDSGVYVSGTFKEYCDPKSVVNRYVYHPLISPIFQSTFQGCPPILIQAGDCEMLRDETIALAFKIQQTNGHQMVRHELYTDMVHIFQMIRGIESSRRAWENIFEFVKKVGDEARDLSRLNLIGDDYYKVDIHNQ